MPAALDSAPPIVRSAPQCVWVVPVGSDGENAALEAGQRLATHWNIPLVTDGPADLDPRGTLKVEGHRPRAILLPVAGTRLAAAIAHRTGGALHAGCLTVRVAEDAVEVERALYRRRIKATLRISNIAPPLILTLHPGLAAAPQPPASARPLEALLDTFSRTPAARVVRRFRVDPSELDLAEADVIVAGGRGAADIESWSLVERLAAALNATVAGSRVAMERGRVTQDRMIGESGRSVSPNLYIAVGISGAPQHLTGIRNARYIVAINKDRHAPIFRTAHLGIAGDIHDVVPALIARLQGNGADLSDRKTP